MTNKRIQEFFAEYDAENRRLTAEAAKHQKRLRSLEQALARGSAAPPEPKDEHGALLDAFLARRRARR